MKETKAILKVLILLCFFNIILPFCIFLSLTSFSTFTAALFFIVYLILNFFIFFYPTNLFRYGISERIRSNILPEKRKQVLKMIKNELYINKINKYEIFIFDGSDSVYGFCFRASNKKVSVVWNLKLLDIIGIDDSRFLIEFFLKNSTKKLVIFQTYLMAWLQVYLIFGHIFISIERKITSYFTKNASQSIGSFIINFFLFPIRSTFKSCFESLFLVYTLTEKDKKRLQGVFSKINSIEPNESITDLFKLKSFDPLNSLNLFLQQNIK